MSSSFAALAGMGLFAMLMMVVVGILVGALILSLAFRLVVGIMRPTCARWVPWY